MGTLYLDTSALVKRYNAEVGSQWVAQQHRLRGYDAIHLATAFETNLRLRWAGLSTLILVAADDDLLAAAHAEGLPTENPNHHN